MFRYCHAVNSLNHSLMNAHPEDTPAVSKVGATRSHEWMHQVMRQGRTMRNTDHFHHRAW